MLAAFLSLLAWQVMIAAMMLPSRLALMRLYGRAFAGAQLRGWSMAAVIAGYVLV